MFSIETMNWSGRLGDTFIGDFLQIFQSKGGTVAQRVALLPLSPKVLGSSLCLGYRLHGVLCRVSSYFSENM